MIIYYVDGVCGSYKTTHALQYAAKAATTLRQPILFVQPTTKLITQSVDAIRRIDPHVVTKRFDSTVCSGSVFSDLHEFMSAWDIDNDGGCVAFITHKCLWEMPWFPNRKRWNIIIDEIPDIDFEYHFNLPDTAHFALQDMLQAVECGNNTMMKLLPRPEARNKVEHWARNPGADDLIKVVQPLFRELTSQHSEVFITRASWLRLGWQGHGKVSVHGWRAPSVCEGWRSVRIMGAFFTDSLLHMIWSNMDVEFRQDQQIKVEAHRHIEQLGKRVSIHYFSEKAWSKKIRDKIATGDDQLAHIKPILSDLYGDAEYLWSANNDVQEAVIASQFPNAIRIPPVCHGLNEYRHIDKIAFLSALNNTPGHFFYVEKVLGISPDRLKQARSNQVAYQSIMRTALRESDSTKEVTVLVPDIALGNWLTEVFPGSKLYAHEAAPECRDVLGDANMARGRPHKESVLTPAERKAKSVQKRREISVTKNSIYKVFFVTTQIELSHELSVKSLNVERSGHIDWDDIRTQLRRCHDEFRPQKEDNTLVSGALFELDNNKEATKGLANITLVNGVWLDFDGGALSPDEFAKMFTDVRWWMWNSFNNGKENETRFRVLLPTTSPLTAEMYHTVWDAIAERIKSFGYCIDSKVLYEKSIAAGRRLPPNSGLDVSKRTANSFFYLPCRAGLGNKYTFWRENWVEGVPLLDPELWITYAPLPTQEYQVRAAHQNPRSATLARVVDRLAQRPNDAHDDAAKQAARQQAAEVARQDAVNEWRSTPRGTGHDAFNRLAWQLRATGMDDFEVRRTLEREAAYGRSQAERRAEIPGIMAGLRSFNPA